MSTPTFPYIGSETRCYWKEEASFGVFDAAQNCYSMPWTSVEHSKSPSLLAVKTLGSPLYNSLKRGMRRGDVKLAWALPSNPSFFLKNCWDLKSFDLEVLAHLAEWDDPTDILSFLYSGCRCNRLSVESEASEKDDESMLVRASGDFIAQKLTDGVAKQSSGLYVDSYGAAAKVFGDTYVKLDGSAFYECISWKLDFAFNLKAVPVIRAVDGDLMKYLQSKRKDVSALLTLDFESKTRFDDVIADTARTWEFGLGASGHYVTFTDAKISLASVPAKVDDVITCKINLIPLNVTVTAP